MVLSPPIANMAKKNVNSNIHPSPFGIVRDFDYFCIPKVQKDTINI